METTDASITFFCPRCRESFQFDDAVEDQFMPCPFCGVELLAIKKSQESLLEPSGFNLKNPETQNKTTRVVELR